MIDACAECEVDVTPQLPLDRLRDLLDQSLGDRSLIGNLTVLTGGATVADATTKVLIRSAEREPVAVLLLSSPEFPDSVAKNRVAAEAARTALGQHLGSVIPEPLCHGNLDGRSYVALPYFEPLSSGRIRGAIQRRMMAPRLMEWLRRATQATVQVATDAEVLADFSKPLMSLANDGGVESAIRAAAASAANRIDNGRWNPRHVLTHDDLWIGNVLLRRPHQFSPQHRDGWPFVIIDWAGARVRGHAIYDLVRLSKSMGLRRRFRLELQAHCQILGCEPIDARGYLLAALGYLGMHLNQFPRHSYLSSVASCSSWMEAIES